MAKGYPQAMLAPPAAVCAFCGKSQHEVETMISGPGRVFICSDCIEQCREIVIERRSKAQTYKGQS